MTGMMAGIPAACSLPFPVLSNRGDFSLVGRQVDGSPIKECGWKIVETCWIVEKRIIRERSSF